MAAITRSLRVCLMLLSWSRSFGSMDDDPRWGCGLLGHLPGISSSGIVSSADTRKLIDGIKASSSFGMVNYWNWNKAPQTTVNGAQYLSKDFIFMPEEWGVTATNSSYVRQAGDVDFQDSNGHNCPATMGNIFLGANEPDITGSCLGNMMGKCTAPCDSSDEGNCPIANSSGPPAEPNANGHCDCSTAAAATGIGFWSVEGCKGAQPLPTMWEDPACTTHVMSQWKQTAQIAVAKGYKYLSTPLIAVNVSYARKWIEHACGCSAPGQCNCTTAECGCPVYVGFHFYAYDCQPSKGGYADFQAKLGNVSQIMEDYPFVKGAIINEVGMLNCAADAGTAGCVPNSGQYPASKVPDNSCPANDELPNGLASFVDKLFDMVSAAKTKDGRSVVKSFSWFNEDMDGGTYNLRLFEANGTLNSVGEAYIRGCQKWASHSQVARSSPSLIV